VVLLLTAATQELLALVASTDRQRMTRHRTALEITVAPAARAGTAATVALGVLAKVMATTVMAPTKTGHQVVATATPVLGTVMATMVMAMTMTATTPPTQANLTTAMAPTRMDLQEMAVATGTVAAARINPVQPQCRNPWLAARIHGFLQFPI
jgi:hypothetical protein